MIEKNGIAHTILLVHLFCTLTGCGGSTTAPNAPTSGTGSPGKAHPGDHDRLSESKSGPIQTCAAAVQKVDLLRAEIRAGFSENDLDGADGPVHEIGHVLEDLQELVAKERLTDAQKDTATKSIDALFEAFGALDKTIHSGKGKTYSDLAAEIDKAIADLQALFPQFRQSSRQETTP